MKEAPLIKLIGDPQENFYQLGIKDKHNAQVLDELVTSHLGSPSKLMNLVMEQGTKFFVKKIRKKNPILDNELEAYTQGLGRSYQSFITSILLPEILSCPSYFSIPIKIPVPLIGCSSFFSWDEKQDALVHGRSLDFQPVEQYVKNERSILYCFDGEQKVLSHSSGGIPTPSITAMNESGISMAIHQKFTDYFNDSGNSIFVICNELIRKCYDLKSVEKFLQGCKTMTAWGIYLGFPDGKVLAVDICGDDVYTQTHQVEPQKPLYFCNKKHNPRLDNICLPHGKEYNNNMRTNTAKKKMKLINGCQGEELKSLKIISTPLKQTSQENWQADTVSLCSISISTLTPKTGSSLVVASGVPKYFEGNYYQYQDVWGEITNQYQQSEPLEIDPEYKKGMTALSQAQSSVLIKDYNSSYHHLQLAQLHLKDFPEKMIADFFFLVCQYINESYTDTLEQILCDFLKLKGTLPEYLNDQCLLFINRLERKLKKTRTICLEDIQDPALAKIFSLEEKLSPTIVHKTAKYSMKPLIDLLDVVHIQRV